ncbi:malto-oligosyltrehalose synthase [Citricoccus sp.]|uniref:malto-oligosyltrehalose synthase n=1 Tax=Citricoccus sp. TaxID=1978372 RepID=UPI00262D03E4|nr:malto-oligosyltrehalose synthase [Citricoccus sp.]HRO30529.1 malto-oligosyltrehalose synthase [Citricoccus sp.]HRO93855.1 malto-oligosyltrehalose synthase [Citricoccus sp.]
MTSPQRVPASTYRLQLTGDFTLDDARTVLPYLRDLGVDWVYLSPMLGAEEGSTHGYDVVDPTHVDDARGGEAGLRELAEAVHEAGGGILADIVPNHVGVATPKDNAWWWDVLKHGRASKYAMAFDIDWAAGDSRIWLPVLGDGTEEDPEAELSRLRIVDGELHYYDNVYPLAPGTEEAARAAVAAGTDGPDGGGAPADRPEEERVARAAHALQNYRLMPWREADERLNYRRFFAVNSLAGVRVEIPRVFSETHREILSWVRDGLVDGLRVDHPDGLADPGGYFENLRQATGGIYLLGEKILEPGERMPAAWAVDGTTGYDALGEVDRVLVDPAGAPELDAVAARLGDWADPDAEVVWAEMIHGTKRAVADGMLRSEVERLARLVPGVIPGEQADGEEHGEHRVQDALAELLACFPVYRSYLPTGREHLDDAAAEARRRRPELADVLEALMPLLADPDHPVAERFQQTSGMVMAKGVEDTAFYRYTRLASLNEVGGDPSAFALDLDAFHAAQADRQARMPRTMTTLSTHDTKRSEDVRARIDVLSEIPREWTAALERFRQMAPLGDGPFEKLLWETVVGAWPVDGTALETQRLADYALKAAREAATRTTWTEPDERFEALLADLAERATGTGELREAVQAVADRITVAGVSNQLAMKLIQLTMPGIPDVYQGTEVPFPTLVDPDNRRPVDFRERAALLARLDGGWTPEFPRPAEDTGQIDGEALAEYAAGLKLLVTSRALRARREHPEWFNRYQDLDVLGEAADHVVAFSRGGCITLATRWPLGLADEGGWGDTAVVLPRQAVVDLVTGRRFGGAFTDGTTRLAEIFEHHPVALLVPEEGNTLR